MELRKTLDASVENQAVGQAAAEMFLEKIKKGTFHVPGLVQSGLLPNCRQNEAALRRTLSRV